MDLGKYLNLSEMISSEAKAILEEIAKYAGIDAEFVNASKFDRITYLLMKKKGDKRNGRVIS